MGRVIGAVVFSAVAACVFIWQRRKRGNGPSRPAFTLRPLRNKECVKAGTPTITFGAEVLGLDLSQPLSPMVWKQLLAAFHEHKLLLFRKQTLTPEQEVAFAHRFDPKAGNIWRDQRTNPWERYKADNMGGAGTYQLPHHPEILAIGKGEVKNHHGLTATLGGRRKAYGKDSGSQVLGGGMLQWHIDGAFFRDLPPRSNVMYCIEAPQGKGHDVEYGDGSGDVLFCPKGSTAFADAAFAYEMLSDDDKRFCDETDVVYSRHPFWLHRSAKTGGEGLLVSGTTDMTGEKGIEGEEEWEKLTGEREGVLRHPLVWTHPVTGRKALMPHPRCLDYLEHNGERIEKQEARELVAKLMRSAVVPVRVLAHHWQAGDLVAWDNFTLWHSATGGLDAGDRRLMHLMAWAGSVAPSR